MSLGAKPEAVAVGYNELVLICTVGTGTGQAVLTTYNPSAFASSALQAIVVAPSAPTTPQLPPPNGLMYFASSCGPLPNASADTGTVIMSPLMLSVTSAMEFGGRV